MAELLTTRELLRVRMHALGLSGASACATNSPTSGPHTPAAVVRHMLAVQGQDWRSSRWAIGLRSPGARVHDIADAFNARELVRSWPMRGTIHVVAAEDIGWMQGVTNHRVLGGAPKRREFLGMSDAVLEQLVEVSTAALSGGISLTRDELSNAWTEAGVTWQSAWRYHVIWWLCQNGITTFGPVRDDAEPRLVLADGWIQNPRSLHGDEALVELAARYAAARGPIRAKDFSWWTGLTVRESRRGLELAVEDGRLTPVNISDADTRETMWAAPGALSNGIDALPPIPRWLLLPSFDEHLLGFNDRSAQLDPGNFERIVPGRNGMFLATVVASGRVAGTWKRGTSKKSAITATPLPGAHIDSDRLRPRVDQWARFHGIAEMNFTMASDPPS